MSQPPSRAFAVPDAEDLPLRDAYAYVQRLLEAGDLSGAREVCARLLEAYPQDLQTHLLAGETQFESGNAAGAGDHFAHVLRADPQSSPAHIGFALVAESLGDNERAVAAYATAISIDPAMTQIRDRLDSLAGVPQPHFNNGSLLSLGLASGDPLSSLAQWYGLEGSIRRQPWARLVLLQALWRTGRHAEADEFAGELRESLAGSLEPVLIQSWKQWVDGDREGSVSTLSSLKEYDPSGTYLESRDFLAPPGWTAPDWNAHIALQLTAMFASAEPALAPEPLVYETGRLEGEIAQTAEPPIQAESAIPEMWASTVESLSYEEPEPVEAEPPPDESLLPEERESLRSLYGDYATDDESMPSWWTGGEPEASESPAQDAYPVAGDPYSAAYATDTSEGSYPYASTIDPYVTDVPEAPAMPEAPEPQPEITDLPTGPDIEPPAPEPEIRPGYVPGPEVTDIPPATTPEIPQMPPPTGVPEMDPGGLPVAPMGFGDLSAGSAVARAEELVVAGYYADALEVYAEAFRQGELEAPALLARVIGLEQYLIGYAAFHRLLGDLYRRTGSPRRAMREYQLALQLRSRKR